MILGGDINEVVVDSSVRVLGRLQSIDCAKDEWVIECVGDRKNRLRIDTSLIPHIQLKMGSLYHFIGEIRQKKMKDMAKDNNKNDNKNNDCCITLQVRIAKNANDVNVQLYVACVNNLQKSLQQWK